jgi:predicted P-loop ATPase
VKVQHKVNLAWLRENREQLFAEAVKHYRAGRKWWVYPLQQTREEQSARIVEDPWESRIVVYLKGRSEPLLVSDILEWALGVQVRDQNHGQLIRVGSLLKRLGCKAARRRVDGVVRTVWTIPDEYSGQPLAMAAPVRFEQIENDTLTPVNGETDLIGNIYG